jgi:hypothetical protein
MLCLQRLIHFLAKLLTARREEGMIFGESRKREREKKDLLSPFIFAPRTRFEFLKTHFLYVKKVTSGLNSKCTSLVVSFL